MKWLAVHTCCLYAVMLKPACCRATTAVQKVCASGSLAVKASQAVYRPSGAAWHFRLHAVMLKFVFDVSASVCKVYEYNIKLVKWTCHTVCNGSRVVSRCGSSSACTGQLQLMDCSFNIMIKISS